MAKNFETKFPKVENNLTGIWKYFLQDLFHTNCQNQLPKSHWPPDICILGAWLSHLRGCWTKGETIMIKKKGQLGKRYSRNGLHNQICTVQWLESHTVYSTQTHPKRSKDDFFVLDDNLLSIFLSFCFFFFSSCFLHIVLLISALSWESLFISC